MKEFAGSQNYVADPELLRAVNIAMVLEKPLLIKGEPGTGKTMLAQAISQALGKKLVIWNIKSTTKAQDGLYVYDVVQRLYDSQFGTGGVDNIARYIKLGKLGDAFTAEEQAVLLIDEIDKADLEFPNDLLWELDQMEFYIPETQETIRAKHRPIVIITSNNEKELPDAFLEAARLDGANEWQVFTKIVFPFMKPACSTLVVFTFVASWNDAFSPLVYITQDAMRTLPVALQSIGTAGTLARAGAMAAGTFISVVPTVLIYTLMQRRVIETMAYSGIK